MYFLQVVQRMVRRSLSPGTMTGFLFAVTGIACIVVFVVLAVQQHNELAPAPANVKRIDLHGNEMPGGVEMHVTENHRGELVGRTGPSPQKQQPPKVPMISTAQCNGPSVRNCTRKDMWDKCFIPLADLHPKDGYLTRQEVQMFMENHLRFYERWAAPSAEKISMDCDKPHGGNGRVNWPIFGASVNTGCLGSERDICLAKGACERELEKLGLPPVVPAVSGHKRNRL